MDLSIEDDAARFLGVLLHKNETGSITLTQIGLIDQIISALGLEQANSMSALVQRLPLGRDLLGAPFLNHYNYVSVVGMMMYLCTNSHPEISFAVHQCAQHAHSPTHLHGNYLKHIGCYLKAMCN